MEDSVVLRFPNRSWAVSAIDALGDEGFAAALMDGPGCDGQWRLVVAGPAAKIACMRQAMHGPQREFCWESFVNQALAG